MDAAIDVEIGDFASQVDGDWGGAGSSGVSEEEWMYELEKVHGDDIASYTQMGRSLEGRLTKTVTASRGTASPRMTVSGQATMSPTHSSPPQSATPTHSATLTYSATATTSPSLCSSPTATVASSRISSVRNKSIVSRQGSPNHLSSLRSPESQNAPQKVLTPATPSATATPPATPPSAPPPARRGTRALGALFILFLTVASLLTMYIVLA